jgi:hypothetical protein
MLLKGSAVKRKTEQHDKAKARDGLAMLKAGRSMSLLRIASATMR